MDMAGYKTLSLGGGGGGEGTPYNGLYGEAPPEWGCLFLASVCERSAFFDKIYLEGVPFLPKWYVKG